MFQVRVHGRGGQGVVTAAELLSVAAFIENRYAQAFPSFGSERMGAPVTAFCRIHTGEIRTREPIDDPDCVIVQDATLLHSESVFAGLKPDGYILINSPLSLEDLGLNDLAHSLPDGHARTVDASEIARRTIGRPIPNAALLGALAALTGVLDLEAVNAAILQRFSGALGARNMEAALEAFTVIQGAAPVGV